MTMTQTLGERFRGIKEQIKGKIKHDPELQQRGKDRISGELKRREKMAVSLLVDFYRIRSKHFILS